MLRRYDLLPKQYKALCVRTYGLPSAIAGVAQHFMLQIVHSEQTPFGARVNDRYVG